MRFGLIPESSKNYAQQAPKYTMVNPLAILNPVAKSIGAFIVSGFGGIAKYAVNIMIA
jgi:hypothetical protein